jgi:predicted dehydrogenase
MSESIAQVSNELSARKPRLGFLGVGWIGRHRMEAIAKSGVADIIAVADSTCDVAVRASSVAPKAAIMTSLDDLLRADVDGIVIATPSALHAEQAIAALECGLAVFCQKPLGRTAGETLKIVEAARIADRLLAVDLSYRFTDGMRKIREIAQAGELGDIYGVNLVFHNAYGPDKPWFYDWKLSGGGCLIDLGIHLIDLALWTLDFPRVVDVSSRLFAQGVLLNGRANTVEDYAVAQLNLGNGTVVQLSCSWKLHAGCDCIIEASFYGTRGGARFRNVNGSFYDFIAERFYGTNQETLSLPPDEWGGRAAIDWAYKLAEDNGFNPAAMQFVEAASVLDSIYGR